ncbi:MULTISPECIES: 2-dehydropantoate 2-reductase [unclassified Brenneria]|uniref:ketopantoate reductase family protein n=1 Tax=unclassified Brenneria TaxID=2634434 RepID=UPI0029C3ECBD|nr:MULTISPECIES: 2-dehydropantoate 2-reductase [unclassified Brenneria]MDX5630924.1 2-dehydropantoate 2-reductase [Brenneria sp. L3-3Z]MDX5698006.1 2-dehydropantoate 2-reductase [Brenneria sp. L4-2C]
MAPHIAVVGAGAVGGYIGAQLAATGENVTLIDRWRQHVEAARRDGLRINGAVSQDDAVIPVRILADDEVDELRHQPPLDIVFISVKSYDTRWAAELVLPYLHPDALVISAQNGCNEAAIAEIVGAPRTAGLIAARIGVELPEPGVIRRRVIRGSPGIDVFRIGELDGRISDRINALATLLRQVDSVAVTDNLVGERWSKLAVNAMRNGVSAATGLTIDALDTHPRLRRFAIEVAGEAVRVGQLLGHRLTSLGAIPAALFAEAAEGNVSALADIEQRLIDAAQRGAGGQRPSMGQDILKGRRTEVDEIYGLVIRHAAEQGIAVPAHQKVYDAVLAIERGLLSPAPENLLGKAP